MSQEISNRLANASSPYLRSAAHQPVDWHEWGAEVFALARKEDKPILLDIGAVWCHWCHVIDRESYDDPELAELINRLFIPVKVDRDERPDVDARYQVAVSAVSGQGGWPLTGFLLPDGRPFFGGTYFPPEDAMGRPSFRRVLETVADAYLTRRHDVERAAGSLLEAVSKAEMFAGARGDWNPALLDTMIGAIVARYDPRYGGFGQGPKFPNAGALDLLLDHHQATRDPQSLIITRTTLQKMARGGVYDQLAGGFHRYSVDERWLVPHFEKMSYDNSELLKNYLHAYLVTGAVGFRQTAEGIIGWVNRTLSDQQRGGFYASQDADISLDDDGDYFTWTLEEVRDVLPPEEARVIELHYDVGPNGEMHHNPAKNVLWICRDAKEIAELLEKTKEEVEQTIASAKIRMLEARDQRPTPFVDTTCYTSWNAMFISAYLEAASVLQGDEGRQCRAFALRTLGRFLAGGWDDSRGFTHRLGARLEGTLDDQACMTAALLDAFEATLDLYYFSVAEKTAQLLLEKYADREGGGFFDRASDAPPMGGLDVRRKPLQDAPTPGGNSVAAMALDRLYAYTGRKVYREQAQATLETFAGAAPDYGLFAATYGLATVLHARHTMQMVITGRAGDEAAHHLLLAASSFYRFGKAILRVTPETLAGGALPPALHETLPHLRADVPQVLVCVGATCYPPADTPEKLWELLAQAGAASAASAR